MNIDEEDYKLSKETQYWAGRLIGHDQAYEIADEIVKAIKYAEKQALDLATVSHQRGLLKSFSEYVGLDMQFSEDDLIIDIENHIKRFNNG